MSVDLETTIALEPSHVNQEWLAADAAADSFDKSRVRVGSEGSSSDRVNDLFDESTRQLLRDRLSIAALILATMTSAVQVIVWMNGSISTPSTLARMAAIAFLGGIVVLLRRRAEMTLRQLRWIEVFVVAVPLIEVLFIQYFETHRLLEIEKPNQVPVLMASISGVVCLFIATYAMFIPSNWRRTAVVAFLSAALPPILTAIQFANTDDLQVVDYPGFATPFLLFTTAIVATISAHFVRSIRHEVAAARQYGQYHLMTEIGRGGMGVVYRAEHQMLKRPAAIKLIRADFAASEDVIARFEQEVQLTATLSHWNTVQIYDYGRTSNGDFYYVMEYLAGKTLAQRLKSDGPMESETVIKILLQICNGLEEAHAKHLVHRDLKPANIFLTQCESQCNLVKILDFGLATRQTDSDQDRSVSGSPAYMSPEQIRGDFVDGRSDIYSIGCVLYECLAGRRLFTGTSITEVINQHLAAGPRVELTPELTSIFKPIIEKCISKSAADRYQDIASLRAALKIHASTSQHGATG